MSLKFYSETDISGRLILPPEILRTLHLAPGTRVLTDERDGKITLKPASGGFKKWAGRSAAYFSLIIYNL